ncbi:DUF5060 domain-containing protein [uncultured Maribacter sp.]|uniref:DUF5060 domain-containing protein n=1 Tax=uncultured Maribacter sp. TaxID=431308 RepID=UPI002610D48E|nr:DUF5060 domain-containing protein [uncultured Maribacter sp.]
MKHFKNRLKQNLIITMSFLILGFTSYAQSEKIHKEEKGLLIVEAEEFANQSNSSVRKWHVISSDFKSNLVDSDGVHAESAKGGKYIEILPDTRVTHEDKLTSGVNFSNEPGELAVVSYKVNITSPGRYYVWVKAFSTGTEDNGVHVGIDGTWPESGQRMQWCDGKNEWKWASMQRTLEVHCGVPNSIYLDIKKPGVHDIQFSMREDGFEMDQWLMTQNKEYKPEQKKKQEKNNTYSFWDVIKEKNPNAIIIKAQEFEKGDFYEDKSWLAVNPNTFKEAEAQLKFSGPSALYDVVVFGVGENDGRSRFHLNINQFNQGNFRPPLSTDSFEEGPDYAHAFSDIQINTNDIIKLKAQIASWDGKEYSRGRWSGIAIVQIGRAEKLLESIRQDVAAKTAVEITGELKKWHKTTLTFDGPNTSEKADFNPFMNYRFNVTFKHKGTNKTYLVPGYYAADGNAGQTSAEKGNKWRVHFSADEIGEWTYNVDFRKGNWSAVSTKAKTGVSGGFMDGASGSFTITETDKIGRDFRRKGRLQYVGERYLKFAETGEYFLKQGPDAPENFLSFVDFDGTFHNDGHKDNLVKTWEAHEKDWKEKDPTWRNGKGKAIVGALNYLASKGLNSVSFLTNNIKGDDQNVFMYVDYDTWDRIDISKMDQWEILFMHAQKLGLFLHFKTLEVENQGLLDNGGVGANSKLYYRELMARFGHHLALNWNLCEENGEWVQNHTTPPQETEQRLAMTHYFKNNDPYHHHLVIHNGIPYDDLLGPDSGLTGPSVQTHKADFSTIHKEVLHLLKASKEAGKQWAVAVDEPGDAQHSLVPDADNPNHDTARRNALWGTHMAGGWGNEWYFGYKHAHSDITCQDYRSRDLFWNQAVNCISFFKDNHIPFWEMENRNDLVGNSKNEHTAYCLAKESDTYVVYLNSVTTTSIDLTNASGTYEVLWYNPKQGGALVKSKVKKVTGGSIVALGKSPSKKQIDWAILLRKIQ